MVLAGSIELVCSSMVIVPRTYEPTTYIGFSIAFTPNLKEPNGVLLDLTLRPREVNHASRIYLDNFGGDSAAFRIVGDQYRVAQHRWLGDKGALDSSADLCAVAGFDSMGDVRAKREMAPHRTDK